MEADSSQRIERGRIRFVCLGKTGRAFMSGRSEEIVEAVLLLTDLGKSPEFIGQQLDRTPAAVRGIIETGRIPATQKTLFADPVEPQKKKPEPTWERVVQALRK